ncbi:MAG: chloride channel protein [Solirubrobacterales bacterium]|nr:chloride channel protein [Solirubrobacterales bacterium]
MSDDSTAAPEATVDQVSATMRSKGYAVLLAIAAVVGVVVSLAAWGFLELVHQIEQELFTHLPRALGYAHGPPKWWYLPVLAIGALITALAIAKLPGRGGHIPAEGLTTSGPPIEGIQLPGIMLAALATLGFGLVLGPEAPLIALGSGLGVVLIRLLRKDAPSQVAVVVAAAGAFAAIALIFASPVIAAILLIEATGIGGPRLPLVLVPGLLAAGIGSLISIGMGSFTGLSSSAFALGVLPLPTFDRPDIAEFGWTIALALAVAVVAQIALRLGMETLHVVTRRLLLLLPLVGLIVAGLAIAFTQATGKSINEVLFSGESQLPGLVAQAGTWSLSALALLIAFKGVAYGLSLGSFRGGPTFPAIYLGAAGGIMASHLAGFPLTPAVAVGIGAGTAAVLKLPLSAVVVATLLTKKSGVGAEPLIIVGVVVSYVVTLLLSAIAKKSSATETASGTAAGRPAPAMSRQ